MSTTPTPTTTPTPDPKRTNQPKKAEEKKSSNKSGVIAFIITTLLALGAAGYLYYENNNIKAEKEAQRLRIDSLNTAKIELQKRLTSIEEQFNQTKSLNADLQAQLDSAFAELNVRADKIKRLIASNASVPRIKAEIAKLRESEGLYSSKIAAMQAQIDSLIAENNQLRTSAGELNSQIAGLQDKNLALEKKVALAATLKTNNVLVIGEKKGKGGKYAPTKLKKAERLLITFDIDENKVADPGEKMIYITVTTPKGKIIENSESGTFTNQDNNISTPYTLIHKVNFSGDQQKVLVPVDLTNIEHLPGNYTIDFYSEGHYAGTKKLAIK